MEITINEQQRVLQCVQRWLQIREDFEGAFPASAVQLAVDMSHSALLQRLLEGKEPFEDPPPLSYSDPWYELLEYGTAACSAQLFPEVGQVLINQEAWNLLEDLGGQAFVVSYPQTSAQYSLAQEEDNWRITLLDNNYL